MGLKALGFLMRWFGWFCTSLISFVLGWFCISLTSAENVGLA